ncbi:hypothetical protein ZWY2020_057346 [Hordeum vulgare]|nr:hypothetical protein ZWY2020_057346 [Hordeum vulgare]
MLFKLQNKLYNRRCGTINRNEGRDLRKVGFYYPIKNQTCLNVPAILYFLGKGALPTRTVYNVLRKAEFFKEKQITLS